jgi:hypothetical protein
MAWRLISGVAAGARHFESAVPSCSEFVTEPTFKKPLQAPHPTITALHRRACSAGWRDSKPTQLFFGIDSDGGIHEPEPAGRRFKMACPSASLHRHLLDALASLVWNFCLRLFRGPQHKQVVVREMARDWRLGVDNSSRRAGG